MSGVRHEPTGQAAPPEFPPGYGAHRAARDRFLAGVGARGAGGPPGATRTAPTADSRPMVVRPEAA